MNDVLFENDNCLIINKRCGEDCEKLEVISGEYRLVHRLDTPASGCLLIAKNRSAAAFLSAAFANHDSRQVIKHYHVITEIPMNAGDPDKGSIVNDSIYSSSFYSGQWQEAVHWIGFIPRQNRSIAHAENRPGTKKAVLRYRYAGRGDHYFFLEAELITGRHHQIRAQLATLDLHIKGDLKYGARRSEKKGGIRLHASALRFPDPGSGEPVIVIAPVPSGDSLWDSFPESPFNG